LANDIVDQSKIVAHILLFNMLLAQRGRALLIVFVHFDDYVQDFSGSHFLRFSKIGIESLYLVIV